MKKIWMHSFRNQMKWKFSPNNSVHGTCCRRGHRFSNKRFNGWLIIISTTIVDVVAKWKCCAKMKLFGPCAQPCVIYWFYFIHNWTTPKKFVYCSVIVWMRIKLLFSTLIMIYRRQSPHSRSYSIWLTAWKFHFVSFYCVYHHQTVL